MSIDRYKCSALERDYARFLHERSSASFIQRVSGNYSLSTLCRLAAVGDRCTRRAAILSIGYLGDQDSIPVVGTALRDEDRGVRLLAEESLRSLFDRESGVWGFQQMRVLNRFIMGEQYQLAEKFSEKLLHQTPRFTEAWYQRGMALAGLGHYREAIESCRRAAALSRYHYKSLSRMGDYHLMLGATAAAIDAYRRALQVHPGLEHVRVCFDRVRRTFEEL